MNPSFDIVTRLRVLFRSPRTVLARIGVALTFLTVLAAPLLTGSGMPGLLTNALGLYVAGWAIFRARRQWQRSQRRRSPRFTPRTGSSPYRPPEPFTLQFDPPTHHEGRR